MRTEEEELNEAQETLVIARKLFAGSPGDPTILPAVINRTREAMRLAVTAMLQSFGLPPDPDRLNESVSVEITKRGGLNEDWVHFFYEIESADMRVSYGFDLRLSSKSVERTLARTEQFISDARKAVEESRLGEHDVVRVVQDVESDGYAVKKGMTGTIVSVYNSGEAYAVEISEIEDGPAVVTLRASAMERIWKSHHE